MCLLLGLRTVGSQRERKEQGGLSSPATERPRAWRLWDGLEFGGIKPRHPATVPWQRHGTRKAPPLHVITRSTARCAASHGFCLHNKASLALLWTSLLLVAFLLSHLWALQFSSAWHQRSPLARQDEAVRGRGEAVPSWLSASCFCSSWLQALKWSL